jgi:polysaccharide pyruvyl transferase WcaK-like protein
MDETTSADRAIKAEKFDCVIWGGYAWGNIGDDLLLAAALRTAQRRFGESIAILSHNPEYTSWLFPDAMVIPYVKPPQKPAPTRAEKLLKKCRSLFEGAKEAKYEPDLESSMNSEWARCIREARCLYLTGGGYLTDLFPLEFWMPPIVLANRMKLSVVTGPLGLGPFKSECWARTVADSLRPADLKVRDQASYDFCVARGLKPALVPDDAFGLLETWFPAEPKLQAKDRPRKIGVCIFPQSGREANHDASEWWTDCLRGLESRFPDYQIEGFCFHTSLQYDFREMVRLFKRAGLPLNKVLQPEMDVRRATAAIRDYDLVISTRFHAVVTANALKVPNIAIASGNYYLAKMQCAVQGHENLSTLVNPVVQSPDAVLQLCSNALERSSGPVLNRPPGVLSR